MEQLPTTLRIREGNTPNENEEEEEEILCIQENNIYNQGVDLSVLDPSKLSLAERVKMFDTGQNIGRPPRIGGATGGLARRRRKQNSCRFQTQPITVDEVEKARKGFLSEPSSRTSPSSSVRSSPLYAMLRPVSLEELTGDLVIPQPRRALPPPPARPVSSSSPSIARTTSPPPPISLSPVSGQSRTIIRFSGAKPCSSGNETSSPPPPTTSRVGALATSRISEGSMLASNSLFRPVISPPPTEDRKPVSSNAKRVFSPPVSSGGSRGSPPARRRSSSPFLSYNRHSRRDYTSQPFAQPTNQGRESFHPNGPQRQEDQDEGRRGREFSPLPSPPSPAPPTISLRSVTTSSGSSGGGFSSRTLSSPPPQPRSSAFTPISGPSSAFRPIAGSQQHQQPPAGRCELTPVSGPIPLRGQPTPTRDDTEEYNSGAEDRPSILKRREPGTPVRNSADWSEPRVPKKSILKYDSVDESFLTSILKTDSLDDPASKSSEGPARGVLKKDPSYERSVSNPPLHRRHSSSSSNDDVARSFTDVVIDPIPGQGRKSAPETPVKRGGGSRTPVIPPSSVRMTADGDLAGKLAKLSTQADNIKQKMEEKQDQDTDTRTKRCVVGSPKHISLIKHFN